MRIEDLPQKYREQAAAKLAQQAPARQRAVRTSQHTAPMAGGQWRCYGCHHISETWAAAQRHADESGPGHRRIEGLWTD